MIIDFVINILEANTIKSFWVLLGVPKLNIVYTVTYKFDKRVLLLIRYKIYRVKE